MANKDNHIFTFIKEDADDEEVDDVKEVKKVKKDKKDEEYELSPDNKSDYQTKSKKFTTKNIPYGSIYDPELKSPVFLKKVNKPLYKRKSIKDIKKEINCLGDLYFKDGQRFYLVKHDKIPEKVNTVLCINDNDANNYYKNNDSTDKSKWIISEIEKQDNINYIKTKYKDLEKCDSNKIFKTAKELVDFIERQKDINAYITINTREFIYIICELLKFRITETTSNHLPDCSDLINAIKITIENAVVYSTIIYNIENQPTKEEFINYIITFVNKEYPVKQPSPTTNTSKFAIPEESTEKLKDLSDTENIRHGGKRHTKNKKTRGRKKQKTKRTTIRKSR